MKNVFSLRKRSFLSPVSTGFTSHIFAEVESSNEGEYRWGHNMLTLGGHLKSGHVWSLENRP